MALVPEQDPCRSYAAYWTDNPWRFGSEPPGPGWLSPPDEFRSPGGNVIKLCIAFDDVEDSHASREYVHRKACQGQMR